MKLLFRALKAIGVLVAFGVALYAVAIAVNWNDRPPSATVEEFNQYIENRPGVESSENSYYFLLGFSAPPEIDPLEIGLERQHWFLRQLADGEIDVTTNPLPDDFDFRFERTPEIDELEHACDQVDANCLELAANDPELVITWLYAESWVEERYRKLISMSEHAEPTPFEIQAPLPSYSHAFDGQRLLFLSAWFAARDGDEKKVIADLDADLTYWRMVQRQSDILLTKMTAVAAIRRHFVSGNEILRVLQAAKAIDSIPRTWLQDFDNDEKSMKRSLIGEWRYIENSLRTLDAGFGNPFISDYYAGATFLEKTAWRLLMPLVQLQDLSNRHAGMMAKYIELFETEYRNVPQSREKSSLVTADNPKPFSRIYNLAGDVLFTDGYATFGDYAVRVSDLEGIRRAALITSQLRSKGIAASDVSSHLLAAELTDPYTDEPFMWVDGREKVVFYGLEPGDRGKHEFSY